MINHQIIYSYNAPLDLSVLFDQGWIYSDRHDARCRTHKPVAIIATASYI